MNVAVEHISTDQPPDETKARDLDYAWQAGNQLELLENGEAYFPRVFAAMRDAQREILLETFILFEDKVCSGLMKPDTHLGENARQIEVSDDQTTPLLYA